MTTSPIQQAFKWVPTVYLMQGLPFALVTLVSAVLYKNLHFTNSQITLITSLFILPWVLKFLMAPALERLASKRAWIVITQFCIAFLTLLLAFNFLLSDWMITSTVIFVLIAFAAAIHDINSDGLYLEALSYQQQSYFIGIRSICYQVGRLLCQFVLLFILGLFAFSLLNWQIAFIILAAFIFSLAFYHHKTLPSSVSHSTKATWSTTISAYQHVMIELRHLPHLTAAAVFTACYILPEAQLMKIIPLFMLDKINTGGLSLNVADVGIIAGGIGVGSMLFGVFLSGILLAKFSLKKCLLPFTLLIFIGNASYLILKLCSLTHFWQISLAVAFSEFCYGLGNGAYMLYLITLFAKGSYAMSLYAISTAIMLLGFMVGGAISGYIQSALGYTWFFTWVLIINFGIIIIAGYNVRKIL